MTKFKSTFLQLSSPEKERRNAKRMPAHRALYLDFQPSLQMGQKSAAQGKDLSLSGVRFASHSRLLPGDYLDLSLHFNPVYALAGTIEVRGRVVRCYREPGQRHYRIACVFDELRRHTQEQIASFLSWLKGQI